MWDHIETTVTSLTLILVNACQIGLVSWYVPTSLDGLSHPDMEMMMKDKVETQQMISLSLEMVSHITVMLASLVAVISVNNMSEGAKDFVN